MIMTMMIPFKKKRTKEKENSLSLQIPIKQKRTN